MHHDDSEEGEPTRDGGGGGEDEGNAEDDEEEDEKRALRLAALEFMVSLSEAKPSMAKKVTNWVEIIVRACLEGMGEFDEDESLESWLQEDVRFHP